MLKQTLSGVTRLQLLWYLQTRALFTSHSSACVPCVFLYLLSLCSNGHDSSGNPFQSGISQPVSRFSPAFPGPWWYPIHNAALGNPLPACNPSILSDQSALFQQEHISTVTEGVSQHLAPGAKKGGRKWVGVKTECENNLDGDCRSTPRPGFTMDTGQWAGSQLSVLACCTVAAAGSCYAIDVVDSNICHCTHSQFLSSSLPVTHTNLFPHPFPFSISLPFHSRLSFPPSPVQRWGVTIAVMPPPWVQALAPVGPVPVKGPGVAPPSLVQVCGTI